MQTNSLPMDEAAERIVRHFQSVGFDGITEAVILQIGLKDLMRNVSSGQIEAAFERANEKNKPAPIGEFFEIRLAGSFSEGRTIDEIRQSLASDFTNHLRTEVPRMFFEKVPVFSDDPNASGTKYDAILKLRNNEMGLATVVLLNDPNSAFIDYLGTHPGNDWDGIMGSFGVAVSGI